MKVFKKLVAVLSAFAILLTMTACHKKDEIALTIDGIEITSALYMNALLDCDIEARSRVNNELTEAGSDTTDIDYYSQTIDDMSYVDYVKAEALDRCREYALYQTLINDGTISMTDDEIASAENYAQAYWNYYGYSSIYEENGVSYETYKKGFLYAYYANAYFMHIYGEGGEKEVDAETISKTMNDKYALVYTLSNTYEDSAKDEEKAAIKSTYEGYASRLEKGEAFKTIYEEINGSENETSIDASDLEDGKKEEEYSSAADSLAAVIGDEDTGYASDDFDTIDNMKVGDVKVVEDKDKTSVTVYKKLNINDDPYYVKTLLKDDILVVLKQKEYDERVDEEAGALSLKENSFATNRFKVKKIVYPES